MKVQQNILKSSISTTPNFKTAYLRNKSDSFVKSDLNNSKGCNNKTLNFSGIFSFFKKSPKIFKKLPEHIEFKPAKNVEEAYTFGLENLNIKSYNGFEADDIDVLNWVNEAMVNVNNKLKGKAKFPNRIMYLDNLNTTVIAGAGAAMLPDKTLIISKDEVISWKNTLKEIYKSRIDNPATLAELCKDATINIAHDIVPMILPEDIKHKRILGEFCDIYHELGHFQHLNNIGEKLFYSLDVENKTLNRPKTAKTDKLLALFNENKDKINNSVSDYASSSPCEFVAEVFSALCNGQKFDEDIMKLYQAFGGVEIK